MASTNTVKQKANETPFFFRLLLVLTVLGIIVTLLPATTGVVQADYDVVDIGGDGGDL